MSDNVLSCPGCQDEMVQGHVLDGVNGGVAVSQWAKGEPVSDFFTGLRRSSSKIPRGTFRCKTCRFLESYARVDFAERW
jgi:hypothetical protein